jgi:O-antigen/teichoic acid export membrane protein
VPMAVLQRSMEFRDLARAWASSNIGSAGVAVGAGLLGAGVWALVLRQLVWFALLAALVSLLARRHLPPRSARESDGSPPATARWFLLFCATQVLALNLDYLVIGRLDRVEAVGLYALAFMIAFAPVEHFSAQVGKVLFAAAAASGPATSGARTVAATRLMAVLLLPLVPVAIVLAPPVLPAVLGAKWSGMVAAFQVLVVAGVGYAIVNCIGEALSGAGHMAFRAKVNCCWCAGTLVVLVLLVRVDGIRGAALAHLVVFAAYAAVYGTAGARRAGTTAAALRSALQPVLVAVMLQSAVTGAVAVGLRAAGAGEGIAAGSAVIAGLGAMAAIATRGDRAPVREAATVLRAAAARGAGG